MARSVNGETLALVKQWEGSRPNAYPDRGSRDGTPWTIGYGKTRMSGRAVRKGDTITEAAAATWLVTKLARVSNVVDAMVKVPTTENQQGALSSLTYNIGDEALAKSTLLKKLNAGNYAAVPA